MILDEILKMIQGRKKIALFSHVNPDGDAIGSCVALKLVLEAMGKQVDAFVLAPIDKNYEVLGASKHLNHKTCSSYDLAIALDCPTVKRLSENQALFQQVPLSINIDHHTGNMNYASINYVDEKACSVSEIVYLMLKQWKLDINKEVATCLYAGITTDTGRFTHTNTKPESLLHASELASLGADYGAINYNLFEKISMEEINLMKVALSKLELHENGQIAIVALADADIKGTHTISQQTYRLTDLISGLDSVKLTVVMSENNKNEYLVSIRSRNGMASKVAMLFGGGGHPNASGCRIFTGLNKAKSDVLKACVEVLKQ